MKGGQAHVAVGACSVDGAEGETVIPLPISKRLAQ
jgi:hypothetical protein